MKNIRTYIYGFILISLIFSFGCYEPIANTSGASGSESSNENMDENSGKKIDGNEEINAEENSDVTKRTEKMKDSETKKTETLKNVEGFRDNLNQNLSKNGLAVNDIYDSSSSVESRLLKEYGAVFLTTAMPPGEVMFTSEADVAAFQNKAGIGSAKIGGTMIELQPKALKALQNAVDEAKSNGLKITPRDGTEAARRSYDKTLKLWNSRFEPALKHWKSKGRLTDEQISKLKSLPIKEQVREVLELEKQKIFFNTFFNNSILYSVAAPGTSQHISMLAFDATEFQNKEVRKILGKYGWFRTVQNDEPHFTFLGYKEADLPKLGLKKVVKKDGEFWIPNI